jgi:hypothetical protein
LTESEDAGRENQQAEAPPCCAIFATRAASRLPSAYTPLMMGMLAPISSWAISSTRFCSSNEQEATSEACALMVTAEIPSDARGIAQMGAKSCLID